MRDDKTYKGEKLDKHLSFYYFYQLYHTYLKRYVMLVYGEMNGEAFNNNNFPTFNGIIEELLDSIIQSS